MEVDGGVRVDRRQAAISFTSSTSAASASAPPSFFATSTLYHSPYHSRNSSRFSRPSPSASCCFMILRPRRSLRQQNSRAETQSDVRTLGAEEDTVPGTDTDMRAQLGSNHWERGTHPSGRSASGP